MVLEQAQHADVLPRPLAPPFGLLAAGVVLCYGKVFLLDRGKEDSRWTTYRLMALLAGAAFLLRTFMPLLPE